MYDDNKKKGHGAQQNWTEAEKEKKGSDQCNKADNNCSYDKKNEE